MVRVSLLAATAATLTALVAMPASASTPAAYAAAARAAAAACQAASDLRNPVARPAVSFSDASGVDAMLVTGKWRPAHMHGAAAAMLCLYDRRTKHAEAVEAAGWRVR